MATFRSTRLATTALAAAGFLAALAAATPADAALLVRASFSTNGGVSFTNIGTVTDDAAGDLDPGNPGSVVANLAGGGITLNIMTSTGYPVADYPQLSTTFNATARANLATDVILRVEYTQTSVPVSAGTTLQSGFSVTAIGSGQTVASSSYVSKGNTAFATSTALSANTFSTTGGVNLVAGFSDVGTYAETIRSDILFKAAVTTTVQTVGGTALTAVPEPATIALLGAGLLGLAAVRRRKA